MMFDKFIEEVSKGMQSLLGTEYEICIQRSRKNNDTEFVGLRVRKKDERSCPVIYLESSYDQYLSGQSMEQIIDELVEEYHESTVFQVPVEEALGNFQWKDVSQHIMFKLVNAERNNEQLLEMPHKLYLDLAVTYYLNLGGDRSGCYTAAVTNYQLQLWNIDKEQLHQTAMNNTCQQNPCILNNMLDILQGLNVIDGLDDNEPDSFEESPFYVLSNERGIYGASAILYEGALEAFSLKHQTDLVILPSSIHEVLLLPDDGTLDYNELQKMVESVNAVEVPREEQLSSHVYHFSYMTKETKIVA